MTSQRWSRLVSVLVFALVLATTGSARAQWGFPIASGNPAISEFGPGYGSGAGYGFSPYGYGAFGAGGDLGLSNFVGFPFLGSGGPSNFIGFPAPGYRLSTGQRPQTTASFQSVSSAVSLVPGWSGSGRRVHRRSQAQFSVPRAAIRR
jgi:hypothetical protein